MKKLLTNKKLVGVLVNILIIVAMTGVAMADSVPNPGVKFGEWTKTNVAGAFTGIVAVVGIGLVLARQVMKAVVAFVFAGIGAIFVFSGTEFAQSIGSIIQSFLK